VLCFRYDNPTCIHGIAGSALVCVHPRFHLV
jgi:hypothetical protein